MRFMAALPGSILPRFGWSRGDVPRPAPAETRSRGALYGFALHPRRSAERLAAERVFPNLRAWWGVVDRLGLSDADAVRTAAAAQRNGTSFGEEARASGRVSEQKLAAAVAEDLGMAVQPDVDPGRLLISDDHALDLLRSSPEPMLVRCSDGVRTCVLVATDRIVGMRRSLGAYPALSGRLRLVPAGVLRRALLARVSTVLADAATFDLVNRYPACSARSPVSGRQGFFAGALALALTLFALLWPALFLMTLHVFSTFSFFACILLRLLPLTGDAAQPRHVADTTPPAELPVYSVLVALYREADVVGDLIAALRNLEWPKSKLDVKLVCEVDDRETIAAIRAARPPDWMEIVEVPVFGPRTKPKALNYALRSCRGAFVALYDAEDVPHPKQLIEAWQHFSSLDASIACVQAPLVIANADNGWIARMFAFEYKALFEGLLPWLSRHALLLPLGGTSNHFRREALEHVGGWDPFNVTEDADLGARLARFGYGTRTISLPTLETAPETMRVWIPQRTRWFKGWALSWLVHMRSPWRLYAELGPKSFLVLQILFAGTTVSALVHPVLIVTAVAVIVELAMGTPLSLFHSALLLMDVVNIAAGYASFWLLGWRAMNVRERRAIWRIMPATVFYWGMASWAAWRAVIQLHRHPHLWEKTPHGAAASRQGAAPAEGGAIPAGSPAPRR